MATNAEDQCQICDVAADDVADGQIGLTATLKIGYQADDQFRQAGAEGYDGQADHDERYVQPDRQAAGAAAQENRLPPVRNAKPTRKRSILKSRVFI